jgi:starch phosphorylase
LNSDGGEAPVRDLGDDVSRHYELTLGRDERTGDHRYLYEALVLALRDRMVGSWRHTQGHYLQSNEKQVAYLSMEFLIGRSLHNAILSMDVEDDARAAAARYACEIEDVEAEELDAGLGNGGLGRLAACFLDSCAALSLPVTGYGIRYEYGMFQQHLRDGYQVEVPDRWLRRGNPWEFRVRECTRQVRFHGRTKPTRTRGGACAIAGWIRATFSRCPTTCPCRASQRHGEYAAPVAQRGNGGVRSRRVQRRQLQRCGRRQDHGRADHHGAVPERPERGGQGAAPAPAVLPRLGEPAGHPGTRVEVHGEDFEGFADGNCLQLNDTHPTVAIPELMRLLMDEHGLAWEQAWHHLHALLCLHQPHAAARGAGDVVRARCSSELLPRVLEIIYEINARFLSLVADRWPGDMIASRRMSVIDEAADGGAHGVPGHRRQLFGQRCCRAAHGPPAARPVPGFSRALAGEVQQQDQRRDTAALAGHSATRGCGRCSTTPRRRMGLRSGTAAGLADHADDPQFRERFAAIKRDNKQRLAELVADSCGVSFDTSMLFDVQVKRIHEYKRQLLNVLHVIHRYARILRGDTEHMAPRCVLIGGKAAPGYVMAKCIIKLVNNVARVINRDPRVRPWLRVAFLPDYNVSAMEASAPEPTCRSRSPPRARRPRARAT